MTGGFEQAAVHFLHSYGYLALFVLLALETSMILHFIPSEVIVTVAAATLATDTTQLVLVIAVSTLGATAGSLMLYAFARYGGRRFLDRHPRFFGLNAKRRARLESWFQRPAGESLVFFLRLVPFLRAAVSIPAGLAEMSAYKFTLYSAAGSLIFNAALAYSTYAARTNPDVMAEIHVAIAYATSRWPFFLALAFIRSTTCTQKKRSPGLSHATQSTGYDAASQPAFRFKSVNACDSRALSVAMNSIASISSRNSAAE